jgi:penicillin-binding protein 1A
MVIIDPYTAEIKALCGGFGEKKGSNMFNRATQARRQPGSSIKPIAVYGPGIDAQVITAASVVDDSPTHLDPQDPNRVYPKNSTNSFSGLSTVRNALRRSINVVAAKIWTQIPDTSLEYLRKLGIDRSNEKNVALSLGGLNKGVTPLEMAAAYVPFVNRGMYYTPTTYTRVEDSNGRVILDKKSRKPEIVFSEQTSFIITSMLKDVMTSGTGTRAQIFDGNMPAAGKTGTTNDNGDRWFVGYTQYYVGATWYGYDNKIKRIYLTGDEYNQAMYIWKAVMEKIHEHLDPKDFAMPDQIVSASVCAYSGKAPTDLCRKDPRGSAVRTEYFIKGTEPRNSNPCDVHISVDVCSAGSAALETTVLMGPYCPPECLDAKAVVKRSSPFIPMKGDPYPADWKYEFGKTDVCTYHTEYGTIDDPPPTEPEDPFGTDPDDPFGANPDDPFGTTPENSGVAGQTAPTQGGDQQPPPYGEPPTSRGSEDDPASGLPGFSGSGSANPADPPTAPASTRTPRPRPTPSP